MHARNAQKWKVYLNGKAAPELQPLQIEESIDGKRMEYAQLVIDPKLAPRMEDYSPLIDMGADVRIEAIGSGIKHVGVVTQVVPLFSPQGETFKLISTTQPYLFGRPVSGRVVYNPNFPPVTEWNPDGEPTQPPDRAFKLIDEPLVFNPEIDGRIFGNMHGSMQYGNHHLNIFLNPDAVQTPAGQKLHKGRAVAWPLSSVVHYLCYWLNPLQVVINNPSRQELVSVFQDSVDFVRNVQISDGIYLPEALDSLIAPLGYHHRLAKAGRGKAKIAFFKRATGGSLVWLNHQRFGEIFDPAKTNVEAQGVAFDSARLFNRIVGRGSKLQFELTAPLVKAWPEDYDEWGRDQLALRNLPPEILADHPHAINAWRKWTLNEGGAYVGMRPEITEEFSAGVKARLKAAGLLEWMIPQPRKLLPTLTRDDEGKPIGAIQGIDVEWRDGEGEWGSVRKWNVNFLEREAGIYIDSDDIPEALIDAVDPQIRVTATIETDFRITAIAERDNRSPLVDVATAVLDLDSQYHWRVVTALSEYKSGNYPSNERDDRLQLEAFVKEMQRRWDNLDVAGAVSLEGVDQHQYKVGDRVAGVKGKNISFRSRNDGTTFPQIAAITYDIEGQRTMLHMQRVRETVSI